MLNATDAATHLRNTFDAAASVLDVSAVIHIAQDLRDHVQKAEMAARARDCMARIPGLSAIRPYGDHETGDDGQSYLSWSSIDLEFEDGRKVCFNDLGLVEMGEYLHTGADNQRWQDRVAELEDAGMEYGQADKAAASEALGTRIDQVDEAMGCVWNLVFTHEDTLDQRLELASLLH